MTIFFVGLGLFVIGFAAVLWGRAKESQAVAGTADAFFSWFLEVLKGSFTLMTEPGHGSGERIAAAGTIISSLGILTTVVGLIAWAA